MSLERIERESGDESPHSKSSRVAAIGFSRPAPALEEAMGACIRARQQVIIAVLLFVTTIFKGTSYMRKDSDDEYTWGMKEITRDGEKIPDWGPITYKRSADEE